MKDVQLRYGDILTDGATAHLTRATLTPRRPKTLHSHDFHELFWVQNGIVRHHLPRDVVALREGDVVCIGPGQRHAVQGKGEAAMVVSVCLHPDLMASLLARFPGFDGQFFWSGEPSRITRDIRQMATLNQAALQLERSDMTALPTEAFLLPFLSDLAAEVANLPPDLPDWLAKACVAAQSPKVFREGAAGLVAQTGYAHAHVSRSMRRYMQQTPSDYINDIRMRHATRALVTDAEPLAEIAADCGIPNLSHFHKLFRQHTGMTPLKYRQKFQHAVVQPN